MTGTATNLNPWLIAQHDTESPAPSDRLIRALEAHQAAEAHDQAECRALQERLPDPGCGLVLDLIAEGTHRHQTLLQLLAEHLQAGDVEAAAPLDADPTMVTTLRALIRDQQEGARYLRHLGRQAPPVYEGLYATLLETMARDSEKHVAMLRYLLAPHRGQPHGEFDGRSVSDRARSARRSARRDGGAHPTDPAHPMSRPCSNFCARFR